MNKQPFVPLKDTELGNVALKLSSDRRILLDFVRTCSAGERPDGQYCHSRAMIQEKAINILDELEED
jgi:hypothetical protein